MSRANPHLPSMAGCSPYFEGDGCPGFCGAVAEFFSCPCSYWCVRARTPLYLHGTWKPKRLNSKSIFPSKRLYLEVLYNRVEETSTSDCSQVLRPWRRLKILLRFLLFTRVLIDAVTPCHLASPGARRCSTGGRSRGSGHTPSGRTSCSRHSWPR